ncbi:MAG: alpha/beta hydrolase family protein [Bryobacteraceae bacterium]
MLTLCLVLLAGALDDLQKEAARALAAIPHARTLAEANRARPELRRKLEASLGFRLLPLPAPGVKTAGTLRRQGFRIEKLVYESLPGTPVAAHLYIPDDLKGRAPAVLFYCGHWWADSKARPDFQTFCINMARLGFVVMSFDPFGQGERGVSSRDHRRVEGLLAGIAQQGFAEYETQAALRILLARPEVDPRRVGMTGASGGGYNTWITTALDDRIAVAVPVVGTSEFFEQIAAARAHDWYRANEHCHFVPGLIRYANNHEFIAMAAPRPLLVIAAVEDRSFPIAGVREVASYGRSLYHAAGVREKFGFYEDATAGHGYQQKKREAAYGWFLKWLKDAGDGSPYAEPATETLSSDDLRCFQGKEPAGPGMVAAVRVVAEGIGGARPWPKLGETAGSPDSRVLVTVGARESDAVVAAARKRGWSIAPFELPSGAEMNWAGAVSLLLDDWFVRRQAAALLDFMRQRRAGAVYAAGPEAGLAAAFAINDARLRWFLLRDCFVSFRDFLERPKSLALSYQLRQGERETLDREIPLYMVPFNGLRYADIPRLLARTPGIVLNPINGDWEPAQPRDLRVARDEAEAIRFVENYR